MRALEPEVINAVWEAVKHLIPQPEDNHPLGCHRPRVPDRVCFWGILIRPASGAPGKPRSVCWTTPYSDTALRTDATSGSQPVCSTSPKPRPPRRRAVGTRPPSRPRPGADPRRRDPPPRPGLRQPRNPRPLPQLRDQRRGMRPETPARYSPPQETARSARDALDRRTHQLVALELRATPTQHRPPPQHRRARLRLAIALIIIIIIKPINWRNRWNPKPAPVR